MGRLIAVFPYLEEASLRTGNEIARRLTRWKNMKFVVKLSLIVCGGGKRKHRRRRWSAAKASNLNTDERKSTGIAHHSQSIFDKIHPLINNCFILPSFCKMFSLHFTVNMIVLIGHAPVHQNVVERIWNPVEFSMMNWCFFRRSNSLRLCQQIYHKQEFLSKLRL